MINITMLCANRPRLLKQALDSIGDLSNATVTIRDAGMNTETGLVAHDFFCANTGNVVYRTASEPMGTGPARNKVIEWTEGYFGRGSHLYLSDDDVYFTRPDWLSILVQAYEAAWEQGFRVVGSYNHPFNQPVRWFQYAKSISIAGAIPPGTDIAAVSHEIGRIYEVYALASQSMLMRWDVWDEFGHFCQTPAGKVCQSEDVDFCNRIRAAGFKVGVIYPPLLVNTGITNSFGEPIPGADLVKSQVPQGVLYE